MNKTLTLAAIAVVATVGAGWLVLESGARRERPAPSEIAVAQDAPSISSVVASAPQEHAALDDQNVSRELLANAAPAVIPEGASPDKAASVQTGALGSLVVELQDREGRPISTAWGQGFLKIGPPGERAESIDWTSLSELEQSLSPTARFDDVPLGCAIQARVDARDYPSLRDLKVTVAGPTRAGEVVACPLVVGETVAFLTGRILNADGVPQRKKMVSVTTYVDTAGPEGRIAGGTFTRHIETDAEARFTLEFTPLAVPNRRAICSMPTGLLEGDLPADWSTELDLGGPFSPGTRDLVTSSCASSLCSSAAMCWDGTVEALRARRYGSMWRTRLAGARTRTTTRARGAGTSS
jgi:hypothetical protein